MDRKKALISQTIFKTKNEMRVHIRFASTSNNFRVRGVVVPMPYLPLRKVRRPNSICEVCILSEIERVTSLTVNKPKYPPPPPIPGTEALCDNITTPDNGSVVVSGYSESSTATFSCDEGYSLNGSEILHCGSDGQWSQDEPTCEGRDKGKTSRMMIAARKRWSTGVLVSMLTCVANGWEWFLLLDVSDGNFRSIGIGQDASVWLQQPFLNQIKFPVPP